MEGNLEGLCMCALIAFGREVEGRAPRDHDRCEDVVRNWFSCSDGFGKCT